MKYKKVAYHIEGVGHNIFTGKDWHFKITVPLSLRRIQSAISYKRDQGFCGTVNVCYVMKRENIDEIALEHFRIYDVPFRGIGRITFEEWR